MTPRPSAAKKTRLIANVQLWQGLRNTRAPGALDAATPLTASDTDGQVRAPHHGLTGLQHVARSHGNLFAELLETVKTHSLGQITHALYTAGGEYRRAI